MKTNRASGMMSRRLAPFAVLAGMMAFAPQAQADSIKPVVNAGSSVFSTVGELIQAAIGECRTKKGAQIPPKSGDGKTLGLGLRCPGSQPPDKINEIPKVSCDYSGSLKMKAELTGGTLPGGGLSDNTASVSGTLTSSQNQNIDHDHQATATTGVGTCPAKYVSWVTVLDTVIKVTISVKVEVNGVIKNLNLDASSELGGGAHNYSFYDETTHPTPLSCTKEG